MRNFTKASFPIGENNYPKYIQKSILDHKWYFIFQTRVVTRNYKCVGCTKNISQAVKVVIQSHYESVLTVHFGKRGKRKTIICEQW